MPDEMTYKDQAAAGYDHAQGASHRDFNYELVDDRF